MKYVDEYRDTKLAFELSRGIRRLAESDNNNYTFMEVCGTHTNTFFKFGLKSLLPENIRLISGPGCPVCVTEDSYIDNAISLAKIKDSIITTFGDMMKVPGSSSSLYKERAEGCEIRVVYSTLDALKIAEKNPSKNIIFLAVGFETTAPTVGMAVLEAGKRRLGNFFIYSAHKLIPPALDVLIKDKELRIDGFMLPAHVSTIIGTDAYRSLIKNRIPGVIAGFEPLDMLQGIFMLLKQIKAGRAKIEIQYNRVAKKSGNKVAQDLLEKVFKVSDVYWRGFGIIPSSGLELKSQYGSFDAKRRFGLRETRRAESGNDCLCGEVIKGKVRPDECKLFAKVCTPDNPKGPCMVSSEGSCSIHYKYKTRQPREVREIDYGR